jgi:hypothetical protein
LPDKLREELHALDQRDNRIRIAWVEQFATWADKANGALALASSGAQERTLSGENIRCQSGED